jgi:hypothetical protein
MATAPVAFYSVADSDHFLGAVALLNSLRLVGHHEPLLLADCGLEAWQRDLLAPHVEVVTVLEEKSPHFAKLRVPLERPAGEALVLVDADVIVLRPLEPMLDTARAGKIAAVLDPVHPRFHEAWEELTPLGPVRHRAYVNSGLLVVPAPAAAAFLELVASCQAEVDVSRTMRGGANAQSPFYYADQDVVNAVLASGGFETALAVQPSRAAPHPPFAGLELVDANRLTCVYRNGGSPLVLHHVGRKPWLHATQPNVYSRLLPRLWLAPDVPLRLDPELVPSRFRSGRSAAVASAVARISASVYAQRGRLGLRRRLARWRQSRVS